MLIVLWSCCLFLFYVCVCAVIASLLLVLCCLVLHALWYQRCTRCCCLLKSYLKHCWADKTWYFGEVELTKGELWVRFGVRALLCFCWVRFGGSADFRYHGHSTKNWKIEALSCTSCQNFQLADQSLPSPLFLLPPASKKQILKCEIDLNDEVEMKLMDNKKMAHSNAWRSHRETTEGLKKSRGKVFLLLLGQCTQVLVDKMKQDTTWLMVSELFYPILLFKLFEKFVLKQSDNQYKMAVLIAEQLSILSFCKDNQVPNATYYDQFTTRVEVTCQAGVCYYTPDLLDTKCVELSCTEYETLTPAK